MTAVTLGDFLRTAERCLSEAKPAHDSGPADMVGTLRELRLVTDVMIRWLDVIVPAYMTPELAATPAEKAAVQQREYLRTAARFMGGSWQLMPWARPARNSDATAVALADAADALSAGYDLIQTHWATRPSGGAAGRSPWSRYLASTACLRAVTSEVAEWSKVTSEVADWLWATTRGMPPESDLGLARASLKAAAGQAPAAGTGAEVAAMKDLLRAVPPGSAPARLPPGDSESFGDLCAGVIVSAERLRWAGIRLAREPGNSLLLSGPAWRRSALSCAITADLAIHVLAGPAASGHGPGAGALQAAAGRMEAARSAWQQAERLWQVITTDTQAGYSEVTTDAGDLVLRMGRIAHANPSWTPAWRQQAPADLMTTITSQEGFRMLLSAVHHATDALAGLASGDLEAIRAAEANGRLYMLSRNLDSQPVMARRYAAAPPDRTYLLKCQYQQAIDASLDAALALDALAAECGAPSKNLAALRAACPANPADPALLMAPGTLAQALQRIDRPHGSWRYLAADVDADAVVRAYVNDRLSVRECELRFATSPETVRGILEANGVKARKGGGWGAGRGRRASTARKPAEAGRQGKTAGGREAREPAGRPGGSVKAARNAAQLAALDQADPAELPATGGAGRREAGLDPRRAQADGRGRGRRA
jgi:hypothetical protein